MDMPHVANDSRPFPMLPPIGSVMIYAGALPPDAPLELHGWMLCDGRTLRAQDYAALFYAIRYTYGGSDDQFNIPLLPPPFAGQPDAAMAANTRYIIRFV